MSIAHRRLLRWRVVVSAVVAAASLAPLAGCRRANLVATPDAVPVADTLRGIVAITGSEPLTMVQLTTADGSAWRLVGDSLTELRAASGLEVVARGIVLSPDSGARPIARFEARGFAVRSANGIVALDGLLERVGPGFVLRLADDRRFALTAVPVALRDQTGARIWWSGPLDRAPNAYGVLRGR